MNHQNTMAATAAANLVQGIATRLYGDAGAGITDLIALNNLVSSQSAELSPGNPLLAVARRNIRQFLAKASFASEMDRFSAGQCLDVMDAALATHQPATALASIYELLGVRNESDAGAEIARLHIAVRQPAEPLLWCMHILGPDDVYPAPTKEHAELAAKALNAFHAARFSNSIYEPTMEAVVAPWPHSAESHAADVAKFIPEWIIPASQLKTEKKMVAPPAQPVDLGPVRAALQAAEGLCICCASVDGYSRNELHAFGVNMRSQFRDALALIDGREVGHG